MNNHWTVTLKPHNVTGIVKYLSPDEFCLHVLETDEDIDVRIDSIGELW
jgi:hypothetical protein